MAQNEYFNSYLIKFKYNLHKRISQALAYDLFCYNFPNRRKITHQADQTKGQPEKDRKKGIHILPKKKQAPMEKNLASMGNK